MGCVLWLGETTHKKNHIIISNTLKPKQLSNPGVKSETRNLLPDQNKSNR